MIYKAPQKHKFRAIPRIFLGGTIDMGASRDWQAEFTQKLVGKFGDKIDIYNPRRDDWDSSWEQSKDNPKFREQVMWELEALNDTNFRVFNFLKDSKSPITFYELGRFGHRDRIYVCCPPGFYRKGNIDIVCGWDSIPVFETEETLLAALIMDIKAYR